MNTTTTERLQRLRNWFIGYYIFQLALGTWASVAVVRVLGPAASPYARGLEFISPGFAVLWSILIGIAIFAVALLLFSQLLRRRNWARVMMLVIAWVTALSSGVSLLSTPAMFAPSGWVSRMMPGVDWGMTILTSVATNLVSLVFSVYMIRVLQFVREVRAEFVPAERDAG